MHVCMCVSVRAVEQLPTVIVLYWMSLILFHWSIATFSFSSIFLLSVSTSSYTATACWCSCVFGAGLELCLFLFHLLMQTVVNAPHRAPAMNTTSEQTTAVMAMAAAIERLFSGAGVRINYIYCISIKEYKKQLVSTRTCTETLRLRVPLPIFPTQQCPPSLWKKP